MKNSFKSSILAHVRSLGLPLAGVSGDGATYSKIVCLFPYFTGKKEMGNISMYAYARDYHSIAEEYLLQIAEYIKTLVPSASTKIHVDKGEGNDKEAAFMAGLGFLGKNSLLINEVYGSFVFIGYVETDLVLPPDSPTETTCIGCKKCEAACPGGAIQNGKINAERCASAISQKKGILSDEETEILKKSGLVWGCDICQTVCPHNSAPSPTPISAFYENLLYSLAPFSMSNRDFSAQFGDRAFSWRGKSVLNRNMEILSVHEKEKEDHTN